MRPTLGVINHELEAIGVLMVAARGCMDLEEEGDEAAHQAVEERRLGKREAEPLDRGDLVFHLGLTRRGLDHLAEQHADASAGTRSAAARAHAQGNRFAGVLPDFLGRFYGRGQREAYMD